MDTRHPTPAVGIVCFRGDAVLLIKRGTPPLAGSWSLPGGRVDPGEPVERAAVRELTEETSVKARVVALVDVVDAIFTSRRTSDVTRHYLLFDYLAEWEHGTPQAGDDAAHAEWVQMQDLPDLDLWSETLRVIEKAYDMRSARHS